MAFMDQYDMELLTNSAEEIVKDELGRQLESYPKEICKCNDCVLDMAALALNEVKPLYRVSLMGTFYAEAAKNDETYRAGVRDAVSRAIKKVSDNPGHEWPPREEEESVS
jgi:competence protein ComFB